MFSYQPIRRLISNNSKLLFTHSQKLEKSVFRLNYNTHSASFTLCPKTHYNFGIHGSHNSEQAGKKFDEARLIHDYLHLTSGCGHDHGPAEISNLFESLKENAQNIENPQSLIALIDKKAYFEKFWTEELELSLIGQIKQVLGAEKYSPSNDKGNILKSMILVSCLSKFGLRISRKNLAKGEDYYGFLFKLARDNLKDFSFINALTISESLIYNRQFFIQLKKDDIIQVLTKLNEHPTTNSDIKSLPKLVALMIYLDKGSRVRSEQLELRGAFQKILASIYDMGFKLVTQRSDTTTDDWVLYITELYNSLDIFQQILNDKQIAYMHSKFETVLNNYYDKALNKKDQLDSQALLPFLKKFYNQPPIKLNPKVLKLIQASFTSLNLEKNLQEIVFYLYFLSKTLREGFKISETTNRKILEKIPLEKNIFCLGKLLEVYASINLPTRKHLRKMTEAEKSFQKEKIELNEKLLSAIEDKIFSLAAKSAKPQSALIGAFQSFASLDIGEPITWLYLFNYFAKADILSQLDFVELYIKLLPAASIKTRNACKFFTNISQMNASVGGNLIPNSGEQSGAGGPLPLQIDPKLKEQMETFWSSIEEFICSKADEIHFDKYSIILFHFVYANMLGKPLKKVYSTFAPLIQKHCEKLSIKQLSEITYSYARVGEKPYTLLKTIHENINKRDQRQFDRAPITEVINLLWGFTMSGYYNQDLASKCLALVEKQTLTPESTSQLLQALGHLGGLGTKLSPQILKRVAELLLSERVEPSFIFVVAYSLVLNRCFTTVDWDGIFGTLLKRKHIWEKNQLHIHYFYLLYTHAKYLGKVQLKNVGVVESFIFDNRNAILNYFLTEKKRKSSLFEKNIQDIIQNLKTIPKIEKAQKIGCFLQLPFEENSLHGSELTDEKNLISPYIVDFQSEKFSLEVNGPHHYLQSAEGQYLMDGASLLKRDFLNEIGLNIIDIPFFEFNDSWSTKNKQEYLIKKLEEKGVKI